MALFALVFMIVALILIGVGIVVGVVACGLAALFIGLGAISSSVVIGIRTGRPAWGLRFFLLQCGLIAGVPAGAICAWLSQSFFEAYGSGWPVLIYGAAGGAFGGLLVALMLSFIAQRFQSWVSSRLPASPTRASTASLGSD